jgi:hypothetical protein
MFTGNDELPTDVDHFATARVRAFLAGRAPQSS